MRVQPMKNIEAVTVWAITVKCHVCQFVHFSWILNPESWILNLESWILNLESWILSPESWSLNPEFWILKPEAWSLKPESRILNPGTLHLCLGTINNYKSSAYKNAISPWHLIQLNKNNSLLIMFSIFRFSGWAQLNVSLAPCCVMYCVSWQKSGNYTHNTPLKEDMTKPLLR